jgi:hypothetical protein
MNKNTFNIAKFVIGQEEEIFYDQPCKYGARYGNHSTYCENDKCDSRKCYAYGDLTIAKEYECFKLNKDRK